MLLKVLQTYAGAAVVAAVVVPASAQPAGAPGHHFGVTGVRSIIRVSERLPNFNIEGLCKATAADDAAANLALPQPVENCVRDETTAKQQLGVIWEKNAGSARDNCEAEAAIGPRDSQSYVDLLACMQLAGVTDVGAPATTLRGGGKGRNKK
jgi:hypothetical protein